MLNSILAGFYERDLRRLIDEINAFKNEANLWKTQGSVKNSSGNLALHIIGGTNFFLGATLAKNGYVRNRDLEFTQKGMERKLIVAQLEALITLATQTLNAQEDMDAEFPVAFDGAKNSKAYVLVQLLAHLNYHLGQINYLRRLLE
jgi:hypothetical protein